MALPAPRFFFGLRGLGGVSSMRRNTSSSEGLGFWPSGSLGGFAMMDINEETIAFYSELGRAITQWAHVEFALAAIVSTCFEKGEGLLSTRGFASIENVRAKLQYADTIVSTHLKPVQRAPVLPGSYKRRPRRDKGLI